MEIPSTHAEAATGTNNACAICLTEIAAGQLVQLIPCTHSYCATCIKHWATTKLTCPLCKGQFETAHHFSDENDSALHVLLTFDIPAPREPERDFSCLDYDFYIAMASKALQNIEEAEASLFAANAVFSARSGTSSTSARSILRLYRTRLNEILVSMLEEARFNPEQLLDEIVLMDQNMHCLWAGKIPTGVLMPTAAVQDDYDDLMDEEAAMYLYRGDDRSDFEQHMHTSKRTSTSKFRRK